MATVIVAEKPDQGRKFASALGGKGNGKDGKIEFESSLFGKTTKT